MYSFVTVCDNLNLLGIACYLCLPKGPVANLQLHVLEYVWYLIFVVFLIHLG